MKNIHRQRRCETRAASQASRKARCERAVISPLRTPRLSADEAHGQRGSREAGHETGRLEAHVGNPGSVSHPTAAAVCGHEFRAPPTIAGVQASLSCVQGGLGGRVETGLLGDPKVVHACRGHAPRRRVPIRAVRRERRVRDCRPLGGRVGLGPVQGLGLQGVRVRLRRGEIGRAAVHGVEDVRPPTIRRGI